MDKEFNFNADVLIYRVVFFIFTAVFTLVLELIDKESNFTADWLIYPTVYLHNIWLVTVSLLFGQLFNAVFTLVLELINKELQTLIYRLFYLDKIWVLPVLLFTQLFTAVFTNHISIIFENK